MHPNEQIITNFYEAFQNHDPQAMTSCYAKNIIFEDPAFGKIQGKRAFAMWYMLIERGGDALDIEFSEVQANDYNGSAKWRISLRRCGSKTGAVARIRRKYT